MRPLTPSNLDRFTDRHEAGVVLAESLREFADRGDVVILGLPRGGVPVAFEVARALHAPLDVSVVRKLGLPMHPELAMGAIGGEGVVVMNEDVVAIYRPPKTLVDAVTRAERSELDRRERAYRGTRPAVHLEGRIAILVDDGLATGASMRVAVLATRQHRPSRVIVAVPVGAPETCRALRDVADDVVCVRMPDHFEAVGLWYMDFRQTTDDEVLQLLIAANAVHETSQRRRERVR